MFRWSLYQFTDPLWLLHPFFFILWIYLWYFSATAWSLHEYEMTLHVRKSPSHPQFSRRYRMCLILCVFFGRWIRKILLLYSGKSVVQSCMNEIKYSICFTMCQLFSYSHHRNCIFGVPMCMTPLCVKLCHLNGKNLMCCFSGERREGGIGAKWIRNERKSVEEDDVKKVISLLRFSRSSPLLYVIAINFYWNTTVTLSDARHVYEKEQWLWLPSWNKKKYKIKKYINVSIHCNKQMLWHKHKGHMDVGYLRRWEDHV